MLQQDTIFGILGIVFIVLKILSIGIVAQWSWWLVLLPLYGPILFSILFWAMFIFFNIIVAIFKS